jgi:hypothetical protein
MRVTYAELDDGVVLPQWEPAIDDDNDEQETAA